MVARPGPRRRARRGSRRRLGHLHPEDAALSLRRIAFVVAVALFVGGLLGGRVEAHAVLVKADPPPNAQLRDPPTLLTLYFSEGIERRLSGARIEDGSGRRFDGGVTFDDRDDALMRIVVEAMPPAYYTVFWETLSRVDGHRVSGFYPLTVLQPDGSAPPGVAPTAGGAQTSGNRAKPERVVTKWLLLLGGSFLVGSLVFAAWGVTPVEASSGKDMRQFLTRAAATAAMEAVVVLTVVGVADLFLQAAGLGGVSDAGDILRHTEWGQRWLIRNAILLPIGAALFLALRTGGQRFLLIAALAGSVAYLLVVSSVSHAAAVNGSFWATGSDFLHLLAASVWVGMLLELALILRWLLKSVREDDRPPLLAAALRRFSLVALFSVALLLVTGVMNAGVEMGSVADLVNSGYGRVLLAKLLLLLPVLVAAGANAYTFRPGVGDQGRVGSSEGSRDAERRLGRTVRVEAMLLVGVLAATALLTQTAPSKVGTRAPPTEGKFVATAEATAVSVTLVIDPNHPGENSFEVYLAGDAASVEQVRLKFEDRRTPGFESFLILDPSNPPTFYVGKGAYLANGGDWKVTVDLRRNTGSDIAMPVDVRVGSHGAAAQGRGNNALAFPGSSSPGRIALLVTSGLLALGLVAGSLPTTARPAGIFGELAPVLEQRVMTRPALSFALLIVVGAALGLMLGAHKHVPLSPGEASRGNRVPSSAASIERGKELFMGNCVQCHGETGVGNGPLAGSLPIKPANLYQHVPYHPDEFFFGVISKGLSNIMPAFEGQLSEEDRWNITNFLRSRFGQPPPDR